MADEEPKAEAAAKPGLMKQLIWCAVGFAVGAGGFAIPLFCPQLFGQGSEVVEEEETPAKPAFLEFGQVVVNINEDRFNRYLKINLTLQVDETELETVTADVETKRSILVNWLLSHLSDKSMEEIRGAAGQNRLRREIQDQFNSVLFPDGVDRIQDVLFEEFNVQ
ncbi:MAG: flagellar basal body-associated FliL family protein [Planctomycetales bacterium]|nr:flagellar basal body-associated FliL family protein [Planctomycetales bacterium]